jgi:hypothetical protein
MLDLAKNQNVTLSPDKFAYALNYQTIFMSQWYQNFTFDIFPMNSIYINIYSQDTGALILNNVTMTFIYSNSSQFSYITDKGRFNLSNMSVDTYTINFDSANFSTSSYTVTVANRSSQTLNAYLTAQTSNNVIFSIKDLDTSSLIEGASLSVSKTVNNTWTIVNVLYSDITGKVVFNYLTGIKYRFYVTASGYSGKTFELNPVYFSTYNIWLNKNLTGNTAFLEQSRLSLMLIPNTFRNNMLNNISFIFGSPMGEFQQYGYNLTYKDVFVSASGVNAYGSRLNTQLNITGARLTDKVILEYYYQLSSGNISSYVVVYDLDNITFDYLTLEDNRGKTYGMTLYERMLIVTLIVIIVAGVVAYTTNGAYAGVVALFVWGIFIYMGFTELWLVLISILFIVIYLIFKSKS